MKDFLKELNLYFYSLIIGLTIWFGYLLFDNYQSPNESIWKAAFCLLIIVCLLFLILDIRNYILRIPVEGSIVFISEHKKQSKINCAKVIGYKSGVFKLNMWISWKNAFDPSTTVMKSFEEVKRIRLTEFEKYPNS